jgi:hypothetical protein
MKVFISHSYKDKTLARKVADVLEDMGFDVWDAEREILPGDNLPEKLNQALKESQAMVVLLTPDSLKSKWVQYEISYALGERSYEGRLIPVLVGSPEKFSKENIPWIFQHLKTVNLPERGKQKEGIKRIAEALQQAA